MNYRQPVYISLRNNIMRIIAIVGIAASLVAVICNATIFYSYFESLHTVRIAILLHLANIFVLLPHLFRFSKKRQSLYISISICHLCFIYTPLIWVSTGGIYTSVPYVVLVFALLILFLLDRRPAIIVVSLYFLVTLLLVVRDMLIIVPHPSVSEAPFISSFSMLIMMLVGILIFSYIKTRFVFMSDSIVNLSSLDAMTGIYNARYLTDLLQEWETDYAAKKLGDYYVALLDIDNFKSINDKFGHEYGDKVLKEIAQLMQRTVTPPCICGRYGGDEFLIIAKNIDPDEMFHQCERFLAAVLAGTYTDRDLHLTVSIGLEERSSVSSRDELFRNADHLMYVAKRQPHDKKSTERRMSNRDVIPKPGAVAAHRMQLVPEAFEELKNGTKTRDYRLYDEKHQQSGSET